MVLDWLSHYALIILWDNSILNANYLKCFYARFIFNIGLKNIYLFLALLSLPCCAWALSGCGEWSYSSLWSPGFLLASLFAKHRL